MSLIVKIENDIKTIKNGNANSEEAFFLHLYFWQKTFKLLKKVISWEITVCN